MREFQAGSFSSEVSLKLDNRRLSDVRQTGKNSLEELLPPITLTRVCLEKICTQLQMDGPVSK